MLCTGKEFCNFVSLRFPGSYIWNDATSCSVLAFDALCSRLRVRWTFKRSLQHFGARSQTCLTTRCLRRFTVINHPGVNTGCIPLTWQRNNAALFFWGFGAIFVPPPDASPPAPPLNPPLFMNAINSGPFCLVQALTRAPRGLLAHCSPNQVAKNATPCFDPVTPGRPLVLNARTKSWYLLKVLFLAPSSQSYSGEKKG